MTIHKKVRNRSELPVSEKQLSLKLVLADLNKERTVNPDWPGEVLCFPEREKQQSLIGLESPNTPFCP